MRSVAVACIAGFVLLGCASTGPITGSASRSPLQPHVDDFRQTVAEGAVAGAIVGGVIGILASGGDHRRMVQNAAIGAAAGGVVGAGVGFAVAGKKQEFARQEDALAAMIADSNDRIARLDRVQRVTDQLITQRRQELARIRTHQAGTTGRVEAQRRLVADLEADRTALAGAVEAADRHSKELEQNIQLYRQRFPAATIAEIDSVRQKFEAQRRRLELTPEQLNAILVESTRAA